MSRPLTDPPAFGAGRVVRVRVTSVSPGPLFPDDGPRGPRVLRRVRGISLEFLAFCIYTVLLPLILLGAALTDLYLWLRQRKPWVGVRLAAFGWWFLFGEMRAMLTLLGIWIGTGGPRGDSLRRRRWLYDLRGRWARSHLGGVKVLFGLRFEVEGLEEAGPGPVIIMMRHASIIDNLLPDTVVARHYGMGLRFVVKRELQAIPTIDIGGRWVPTNFVRRAGADTAGEVERLRALAHEWDSQEGILIYPEGTRFTPKKLARAQEVIAERQPAVSPLADGLKHLLPPRLGGPLALIGEAPDVDVVFCGHVGFDGFQHVSDIWAGELVARTIRIRFWRAPAAEIPDDEEGRIAWLYGYWQELDDWIGSHREPDRERFDASERANGVAATT